MVLLRSHGLGQLVALSNHAAALAPTLWELELLPLLASTWALEDIDVEVSKLGIVEVEVGSTVGIVMKQVGTGPVQDGHEVVADAVDALCCQVTQTLLVNLYLVVAVRTAIFDSLYDGQRFYHAPAHAVAFNIFTQVANLLAGPHLTEGDIMQGSNNALYSDLS